MLVEFYLLHESPERFVTSSSNMEVVPSGMITIGDKDYEVIGLPRFVLDPRNDVNKNSYFRKVVVIVSEDDRR